MVSGLKTPRPRETHRRPANFVRRCHPMAYDEDLANRIRELLAGEPAVTEKQMFGGLAFLIGGNMAVAASGQGGIMVRIDAEESGALIQREHASLMVMRGR